MSNFYEKIDIVRLRKTYSILCSYRRFFFPKNILKINDGLFDSINGSCI